jgi:hypothetical protein
VAGGCRRREGRVVVAEDCEPPRRRPPAARDGGAEIQIWAAWARPGHRLSYAPTHPSPSSHPSRPPPMVAAGHLSTRAVAMPDLLCPGGSWWRRLRASVDDGHGLRWRGAGGCPFGHLPCSMRSQLLVGLRWSVPLYFDGNTARLPPRAGVLPQEPGSSSPVSPPPRSSMVHALGSGQNPWTAMTGADNSHA